MLSAKRLRRHAVLFGALLGVVALVAGLSVGVVGFLSQAATDGVRSGLASRAGAELALRASMQLDADAELQDREVRAAIAASFQRDGHPILMSVDRTVGGKADLAEIADGEPGLQHRAVVLSLPDIENRATLVDGSWTASPDEVTMQADAAARLGIETGDRVVLGGSEFTVTGTWQVDDHLDPRWLGDPIVVDGYAEPDTGPVVVDEAAWPRIDTDPRVRWTIIPDAETLTAGDLGFIVTAWDGINSAWRSEISIPLTTLEKQGRFKRVALELGTRVDALRAVEPVALLLLAAIALVTLAELGRLLTTTRAPEIALLWSRGASAADVGRSTAVEVAITAAIGAGVGTAAAVGALALTDDGLDAVAATGAAIWAVPLVVVVATVLVVAGSSFRSAQRQTVRDPSDAAGRARRLAGPGLVILVAAAAALSVWQLWIYGSPVTPTQNGGTQVDPIAVVAPALALVAVVLLGLVLFPRIAALDEGSTGRAGVARVLATRTVSRRLQLVAAPIVVVAVACANLVVAAGYATTWSNSFDQTSQLRAGASVHVFTGPPGLTSEAIQRVGALPGIDDLAPVHIEGLQLGNDTGSILALTPVALAGLATTGSGAFDRDAIAEAIDVGVPGPEVPGGTESLTLTTTITGFTMIPTVTAWIADAHGVLRLVAFDQTATLENGDVAYTGDVPAALADAPAPWRILAIDVLTTRDAVPPGSFASFAMRELVATGDGADTELELDPYWIPDAFDFAFSPPNSNFAGKGFSIAADTLAVRLTPSFDDNITDRVAPPVVISQQLADRFDIGVGSKLTFTLEDSFNRFDSEVVAIVPAVPGAPIEIAVLLDLGLVEHFQLRTGEEPQLPRDLWIDTPDGEAATAVLRPELPANTRIETSTDSAGRAVLGSAAIALWLAAAGCGLLAAVTVAAVVGAQLRARRLDIVVLRALGLDSRMQAAIRRRELLIVLAYGAIVGIVAGVAVTVLTIPQLARAAVPNPYGTVPTPLGVDVVGLAIGLGALVLVLGGIVAIYSIRVSRQARSSAGPEDAP